MQTEQQDTATLFTNYLNVANAALEANQDKFPYKQMLEAGDKILGDKRIGVEVYKERADQPHDAFTVEWKDGTLRLLEHGKKDTDLSFRLKEEYLRQVADNPDDYIQHPARLDLDWLKSRLHLD